MTTAIEGPATPEEVRAANEAVTRSQWAIAAEQFLASPLAATMLMTQKNLDTIVARVAELRLDKPIAASYQAAFLSAREDGLIDLKPVAAPAPVIVEKIVEVAPPTPKDYRSDDDKLIDVGITPARMNGRANHAHKESRSSTKPLSVQDALNKTFEAMKTQKPPKKGTAPKANASLPGPDATKSQLAALDKGQLKEWLRLHNPQGGPGSRKF